MTTEEDGNSLDGTPPEQFAPALVAAGADVVGVNCSVGPAPMLETIERMADVTRAPLAAQPNAGKPRDIEGRNIYLCSPEYMASYARRFVAQGVRLVGGCCGTTPEHIRQIKPWRCGAWRPAAPPRDAARPARRRSSAARAAARPVAPRSRAGAALAPEFVTIVELPAAQGHVPAGGASSRRAAAIRGRGRRERSRRPAGGARMSALSLAVLIEQQAGHRDGAAVLLPRPQPARHAVGPARRARDGPAQPARHHRRRRSAGRLPDATAVFDVDSIGLTNVVRRLNHGLDIGGQPIGPPTAFHIGVMANPAPRPRQELRRFAYKVEAGAEFIVTRPVFDVRAFERLHRPGPGVRRPDHRRASGPSRAR
jgi:methionine synthase / methylenetetrahydrofolate reductase(NADPH)